ncbi:MAG: hypothetical protein Q8Q39_05925 [bacterium]|nr:hypothetical protein [bacterium]
MRLKTVCKGLLVVVLLACNMVASPSRLFGQNESVPLNNDIEPVILRPKKIGVFVTGKGGKPVEGVSAKQWRIVEKVPRQNDPKKKDEVAQKVYSAFSGETPLCFVLAIDKSGSVFWNAARARDMKRVIKNFIAAAVRPGKDCALILPFGDIVENHRPFSGDVQWLQAEVDGITGGNSTPLLDVILTALDRVEAEEERFAEPRRFAIILLTDGQDVSPCALKGGDVDVASYRRKRAQVESRLGDSGIPLYALYPNEVQNTHAPLMQCGNAPGLQVTADGALDWLKKYATQSGGTFMDYLNPRQQEKAFTRIAEELRVMHWLVFYPTERVGNESTRQIKVEAVIDQGADRPPNKRYKRDGRYAVRAPKAITFSSK